MRCDKNPTEPRPRKTTTTKGESSTSSMDDEFCPPSIVGRQRKCAKQISVHHQHNQKGSISHPSMATRKLPTGHLGLSQRETLGRGAATLIVCLLMVATSQPEVEALKFPSLFSWIQPSQILQQSSSNKVAQIATPGQQQQLQNQPPTRSAPLSQQHSQQSSSHLIKSIAGKAQPLEDNMMASASVFEPNRALTGNGQSAAAAAPTNQQQPQTQALGSSLRKPFQSILMLPSKHNQMHLFSALPKSLFGRFLSSNSNNAPSSSLPTLSQQKPTLVGSPSASWNPNQPLRSLYPVANQLPFPNEQQQQQQQRQRQPQDLFAHNDQHQQQLAQFMANNQFAKQPMQFNNPPTRSAGAGRALGELQPKKHALGFGESGDFIMMEPNQMDPQQQQSNHPDEPELQLQQAFENANQGHFVKPAAGEEIFPESPAAMLSSEHEIQQENQQPQPASSGEQQRQFAPVNSSLTSDSQTGNNNNRSHTIELTSPASPADSSTNSGSLEADNSSSKQQIILAANLTAEVANASTVAPLELQSKDATTTTLAPTSGAQANGPQQWDPETASSMVNSANANATVASGGNGAEQQQLSRANDYLEAAILAAAKQADEANNRTVGSSGDDADEDEQQQQTILFLDSQSFQQLQRESAEANSSSSSDPSGKRRMRPSVQLADDQQVVVEGDAERRPFGARPAAAAFNAAQLDQLGDQRNQIAGETSGSESSTAAIIVAPAGGQIQAEQLAGGDSELESFILGPYKGLTSDTLVANNNNQLAYLTEPSQQQQQPMRANHHQFRGLTQAASNVHTMQQPPQQQQQQQQQQLNKPAGTHITNKASSLLQQAKSLIQYPFAHLATGQSAPANSFRGQQTASVAPVGQQRQQLPQASPMLPVAGAIFRHPTGAKQNNYKLTPQQMGFYGNKVVVGQPQQQSAWPQPPVKQDANNRLTTGSQGSQSATSLQPIRAPFQRLPQEPHASYFLMAPPTGATGGHHPKQAEQLRFQQPHLPQMSAIQRLPQQQQQAPLTQPNSKPNVPYFVDLQQQSLNREQQQVQVQQHASQMSDNNSRAFASKQQPTTGPRQQQQFAEAKPLIGQHQQQPLNNANPQRHSSGYQLVIDHSNSRPSHYFEQQQQTNAKAEQASNQARKFKSGLYQIDPPKLSDESSAAFEQKQQHLGQAQDSEDDSGGLQQQQRKVNVNEPADNQETADEDEQLSQQATESPEVDTNPFGGSKQVGVVIGVGPAAANNASRGQIKGQVFNEPLSSASNLLAQGGQNLAGQMSSELKSLKLTQDITLYDFEMPQQQKDESRQQQQQAKPVGTAAPETAVSSPQMNFLDTQVYTVPYTITMPPPGARQATLQPAMPTTYHQFQSFLHHPMRLSPTQILQNQQSQPAQQASNLQQQQVSFQQPQRPNNQLGRFPLPYLAPPAPVRQQPQQQQQQQQQQHQQPQQLQPNQQQSHFLKSLYQELSGQQAPRIDWSQQSLPSIPALSIQTLDESEDDEGDDQTLTNEPLVNPMSSANRQHFFHYHPMNNQQQQQPQQQQGIQMRPAIYQQQPGEQIRYELAGQSPANKHQFVLAIQHQTEPANAQFAISANQMGSMLNNANQHNAITTETTTASGDFLSPSRQSDKMPMTTTAARASEAPTQPTEATLIAQQQHQQDISASGADDDLDDDESPIAHSESPAERKRPTGSGRQIQQQQQLPLHQQGQQAAASSHDTSQSPSSPSAFCTDRAPGLYADESQRCKAYYQCAPTGHQMFRCNNQTQFNQKTQNCDWWYNVNCGGRQGSQSDFEQAAVLTVMANEPANGNGNGKLHQPDREAAASSHEPTGALSFEPQQQPEAQQLQHLSALRLQQSPRSKLAGRWSDMARQQQLQFHVQQKSDELPSSVNSILFREVAVNSSTDAPGYQTEQLPDQQAVPTSATPVYTEMNQQQQQQSGLEQRDSTTQDSRTAPSGQEITTTTTENPAALPEPKPQVGANLSDEQQQQSLGAATSSPEEQLAANSTGPAATSSSLISDSTSTQSSVTTTTSSTSVPAETEATPSAGRQPSGEQQPESRLGQQQQGLFQQQGQLDVEGLDLQEQEQELRDQQQQQQQQHQTTGETKRLVQSEFGLGVQQQQFRDNTKSARSAIRFEFTRNGLAVRPHPQSFGEGQQQQAMLITGNLLSGDNEPIINQPQQPQYSNHKYSFADQTMTTLASQNNERNPEANSNEQPTSASVYSAGANQGSINYVPMDVHFLTAKGVQEATSSAAIPELASVSSAAATAAVTPEPTQQSSQVATLSKLADTSGAAESSAKSQTSGGRKLDRRFGARLLSPTTATSSPPVRLATGRLRRNMLASSFN